MNEQELKNLLTKTFGDKAFIPFTEQKNNLIENIKELLKGIDQTDSGSNDGWWETSVGAEFGRDRLNKLIELIESNISQ